MPELRRLAAQLVNRPLVPTPGMDEVAARAKAYKQRRQVQLMATAVACLLVVSAAVLPTIGDDDSRQRLRTADEGQKELPVDLPPGVGDLLPDLGSTTSTTTGPATTTSTTTRPGGGGTTTTVAQNNDACPGGQNAGATDVGVTATEVKILVRSSSPYDSQFPAGARGAASQVNAQGGVCGRKITLDWAPPSAEPKDPSQYFAVISDDGAGIPSGIPVFGGHGLAAGDFASAWSWPVGTPAASQARIAVKHAWDSTGSRSFGIVYDNQAFGTEANSAFTSYVQSLGGTVTASKGVTPMQSSYSGDAAQFAGQCGSCDFVLFALDTITATGFVRDSPVQNGKPTVFGKLQTAAMSPAMGERFAQQCGGKCNGLLVWDPIAPAVGDNQSDPDVASYVNGVKTYSAAADVYDQSVQRFYVGTKVLLAALAKTGANLTRARLKSSLDSMTYTSGLVTPLRWVGDRMANKAAQVVEIHASGNSFGGFTQPVPGFLHDPKP